MDDRKKVRNGGGGAKATASPSIQSNGVNNNNKKRKNKRRRNPQRKGSGSVSSSHRGPPLAPTLKVTIRNIRDADVAQTIRTLVATSNENSQTISTQQSLEPKLMIDEKSLQKLINYGKLVAAATAKWQNEIESKGAIESETKTADDLAKTDEQAEQLVSNSVDTLAAQIEKSMNVSDVGIGDKCLSKKQQIVEVRTLYFVPPKGTRRRGEKPGVAYLVLAGPPIEKKILPITELHPISEEDNNTDIINEVTSPASDVLAPVIAAKPSNAKPPNVDYSRDIAQRRLLLQNALESLQFAAKKITNSMHSADTGLVVEESMNTKIWKQQPFTPSSPVDRMAGSIFTTDDYQQFIENTQRSEQERKARPKPPPGGGVLVPSATTVATSSSGGTTPATTTTNGAPVAALVLHLQKKQEEENKRKLAKQLTKVAKKNTSTNQSKKSSVKPKAILTNGSNNSASRSNRMEDRGTGAAASTNKKQRNHRRVKKSNDSKSASTSKPGNTKPKTDNRGGG
jgi:hypothetical protein